jgi:hypothetical protein
MAAVRPCVNIFFRNVFFDGILIKNIFKLLINTQKYDVEAAGQ